MRVLLLSLILVSGVSFEVLAQGAYDIKEMTPQIKSALESRRDRFSQLKELKASGVVGEDNQGYVAVLKKNKVAADLAQQENADRKLIYQAIVEQNGLGQETLAAVESAFADVQFQKATAGEMVQAASGEWSAKP